jgi:hypothetical protein
VRARGAVNRRRALFVIALFAALLASAAMFGFKLVTPPRPIAPDQYRGVVQLAPNERGECERFELDNRTGIMRRQGGTWCREAPAAPSDTSRSPGPLGGVHDYFRSR